MLLQRPSRKAAASEAIGHCLHTTISLTQPTCGDDLPGGASRLYKTAKDIDHDNLLVNGIEGVRGGELTGATGGSVLRSELGPKRSTPTSSRATRSSSRLRSD